MTQKLQAAAQIRTLANTYKNMVAAAEMLESIGTLDQAAAEAQLAVDKARGDLVQAEVERDQARRERDEARAQAAATRIEAEAESTRVRQAAKDDADRTVANAHGDANIIVNNARTVASQAAAEALSGVEQQQKLIGARATELIEVETAVRQAREELATLQARTEEMRAKLQGLVQNL